jgi:chemotaxis protein methyltransferase CheR
MSELDAINDLEIELLIQAIWEKYHYDFRGYSRASLRRRISQILLRLRCVSVSILQDRLLHDASFATEIFGMLTVPVTEMFRDPLFFRAIKEEIVPILRTYPSFKVWVAGCSTGEEAYSYAILLHEEELLSKALIYATDINPLSLSRAKNAIFDSAQIRKYTENYHKSGGCRVFSDYYRSEYGAAVMSSFLREKIVFSDHSLASDHVFSEFQLVSCRNVLIYFDRELQDRALGLFKESLCRKGFLGLGSKEAIRYTSHAEGFTPFVENQKIFQKR